jgi:site-specific DNA-methyltransferase (cytosine-N4-specific)
MLYWKNSNSTLYKGEAKAVLETLPVQSVDCIVTSPPYYGQRDYEHDDQLGLEDNPFDFIERLVDTFREAHRVLKESGCIWVNIGDTYWSGKGAPTRKDDKNAHRRFKRPQDRTNSHPLCRPKQLLLIPQRFAIAMQEDGWIVRNEIIWWKSNPTPDPVQDRLAVAHEQFYFFTKKSHGYYFDRDAISLPRQDGRGRKNTPTVWKLTNRPTFKKHIAPFQDALLHIPLNACLPPQGVLLDPFCGSATALVQAIAMGHGRQGIGIDVQEKFLQEAVHLLSSSADSASSCAESPDSSPSAESGVSSSSTPSSEFFHKVRNVS